MKLVAVRTPTPTNAVPAPPWEASPPAAPKAAQNVASALEALIAGAGLNASQVTDIVRQEIARTPAAIDEQRVREIAEEVARQHVNRVQVVFAAGEDGPQIDNAHAYLQVALAVAGAGIPLILTGSKGCGKTTLAEQLSKALLLEFAAVNCYRGMTAGRLLGFPNPMNGTEWFRGELSRHVNSPTLVLMDEFDALDAGVQVATNSLSANRYIGEPTGLLRCHERFTLVFATNTLNGATREYNGREKIDGAVLDRCAVLELHMDNAVEAAMCGVTEKSKLNGDPRRGGLYRDGGEWLADVRTARTALTACGLIQACPSPRAGKDGTRLHRTLGKHWLRELFLYRGASQDVRNVIETELNKKY